MGDTVQRLMEDMVPELEDLQKKHIFSQTEIQSIVSQRQGFEYKLRRKNITKLDFLRYIQYELNVTALVDRRKVKLGIEKKGVCDFSAMRRLSFLYERALRKFNHDVELWKQYLEYCRRCGSHHAISKILPRALQLNPKDESLWILHASWELEFQGNIDGGRTVLQRALRMNENSTGLWLAFMKMEIRFVVRVLERKRALGLVSADKALDEPQGEFDLRFVGGASGAVAASTNEEKKDMAATERLVLKQDEALTQVLIPRAIIKNACQVKGLKDSLEFRLEFLKHIPSAYSAALSALGYQDVESNIENDVIPASDPSRLNLASYAYNHNDEDLLLTNFLRYNGKTNEQLAKENALRKSTQMEDADEPATASAAAEHSRHLYHVNFLPLLQELFDNILRDFRHDVHALRLYAQFVYTRARIQHELNEAEPDAKSPEEQAFDIFESALQPEGLQKIIVGTRTYYNAHKSVLDVDRSRAGRALFDRIQNVERFLWSTYIDTVYGLLRTQPENMIVREKLKELYTRAATAGVRTERILRQQVEFMLETGQAAEALTALSQALSSTTAPLAIPSTSASLPIPASGLSSLPTTPLAPLSQSVSLWSRYLELLEKLCAFQSSTSSSDDAHATSEDTKNKKRKKPSSTASSSSSSATVPPSFVLQEYERALKSVELNDRVTLYERLLSFQSNQLTAASSSTYTRDSLLAAYQAIHTTFHRILTSVPQPKGTEEFKLKYLQWMAQIVSSEVYTILQARSSPSSPSTTQQPATKKQKKQLNRSVDSDDEDASDSLNVLPSYIPALTLTPTATIRQLMDQLLSTPPLPFNFLQACINIESTLHPTTPTTTNSSTSSNAVALQLHLRRMKDLYERAVGAFGSQSPQLWFDYLSWSRSLPTNSTTTASLISSNSIHFRATKELKAEHQAEWAELQTMLIQ